MSHSPDEIAYWLEASEARVNAELYRALAGHPTGPEVVADDDSATFLLRNLDHGFFNRSVGLGVGKPATEADLDRTIALYRDAGLVQFTVQLSPFAMPAALESWLEARRFTRGRRWAKLWRDTVDPPAERTDLRLERIGPEHADEWVTVIRTAFEMHDVLDDFFRVVLGAPGWHHYLAFDGDAAVGAGAMRVLGDVAWFGYGATLASHRGRGSQSAVFARRIRDAHDLGVRLCITETGEDIPEDPNPSYRNMLRAGFRLAYQRQNWLPPVAPEG